MPLIFAKNKKQAVSKVKRFPGMTAKEFSKKKIRLSKQKSSVRGQKLFVVSDK